MDHTPLSLFDTFCAAFGGRDAVAAEIHEFWAQGNSPFPLEVYRHLINKRVRNGDISHERAEFLIRYFAESFEPEHTTGYADKHREPLITAFAEEYARTQKTRPIFRVEADIMNLGGLNKALEGAYEQKEKQRLNKTRLTREEKESSVKAARLLADRVIHVMASILRSDLEKLGEVQTIRHGGDEFKLYLKAKNPELTDQELNRKLTGSTQNAIATFIATINLTDVPHLKEEKMAGVGIGCAAIQLTGQSDIQQHKAIESGIRTAKESFGQELGPASQKALDIDALVGTLDDNDDYKKHSSFANPSQPIDLPKATGKTYEAARLNGLEKALANIGNTALSTAELELLKVTHALTAKLDPVTHLPLFKNCQHELLPHFKTQLPANRQRALLMHIDFNNLGGGNNLGYWVGNAMRATFSRCIEEALEATGLATFPHCLMAQDGGRFALLLSPTAGKLALESLPRAIKQQIQKHASDKIILSEEAMQESIQSLRSHGSNNYVQRITEQGDFSIDDLYNPKLTKFSGTHVICQSATIDCNNAQLGSTMNGLQARADRMHRQRDTAIRTSWTQQINTAQATETATR